MKPKMLAAAGGVIAILACSPEAANAPTETSDHAVAPFAAMSNAVANGNRANVTAAVEKMMANGQSRGAVFLPPFSVDPSGNVINAGTGGFFFANFWPSGALKEVCLFFSASDKAFFRVGPNGMVFDHANGPAFAGLFARSTEDGQPLPGVDGSGKLNVKIQGTLGIDTFPLDPVAGTTVSFYFVDQPTAATVFAGVAKVGEFGAADQHLICRYTDDANGNRRSQKIQLN